MTPDQARDLLDGAAPGEWQWDETGNVAAVDGDGWEHVADYVYEEDGALIVAAPGMAAMIAGMHEEWGVEMETNTGWCRWINPDGGDTWFATREQAVNAARLEPNPVRIVRRYVTEPEEA